MQLSYFDIIVALLILFLGLKGVIDGFIKELTSLAGIIGGIYIGSTYASEIGSFISQNLYPIKNEAVLTFVGFLTGLFGTWIGASIIGNILTKLTHAMGGSFFNRFLGLLFGWLKIFLIFAVFAYALSGIGALQNVVKRYTKNSILFPLLVKTGEKIIKLDPQKILPPKVKEKGAEVKEKTLEDIKKSIQENLTKGIVQ